MAGQTRLVLNGVPYDPDLKKLRDRFGVPTRGEVISHDAFEAALGMSRTSSRYRGVIDAWRRSLWREHLLLTQWRVRERGGLVLLNDDEVTRAGTAQLRSGAKQVRRSYQYGLAVRPDQLTSDALRTQRDLLVAGSDRAFKAITLELQAIEPPKAVTALPR